MRGKRQFSINTEKIEKDTVKRLINIIVKEYKGLWILSLVCILISTAITVSGAFFIEILIDKYIVPLLSNNNISYTPLFKFLVLMSVIYIIGIIFNYIYQRVMVTISQGVLKKMRDKMFSHMQTLPISYFDTHKHGDIMSFYTNDVDTMGQLISNSIPTLISSILSIILIIISMLCQSVILTIVSFIGVFFMILSTKTAAEKSAKYFDNQQNSKAKVNAFVEEMVTGQKVIKVFTHEDKAKEQFDIINEELCENSYKAESHANIIGPISNNVGHIIYVLVAIIGGAMVVKGFGAITLGAVAAFLQLVRNFTNPISQVTQQIGVVFQALSGAKRIFTLLDAESEVDNGTITLEEIGKNKWAWLYKDENGNEKQIPLKGDVRLNNVSFSYDGKKEVLHDITLYAKPGQKIAFVGETGAGKTTITNLINRFYDISEGAITYDGIDIKEIKKSDLRKSLGIVLQDTYLFSGTIKDNICYGDDTATMDDAIKAAKLANADEFIKLLPKGYDTVISGNTAELSQGQKQLLSIARVALVNPPVMILDEATSSIDSRTEKHVQDGMDKLMSGRTVFVIAHRLSTVKNAKAIMVLENGKIIERGMHDDLIKAKQTYYKLYTGSFELQ